MPHCEPAAQELGEVHLIPQVDQAEGVGNRLVGRAEGGDEVVTIVGQHGVEVALQQLGVEQRGPGRLGRVIDDHDRLAEVDQLLQEHLHQVPGCGRGGVAAQQQEPLVGDGRPQANSHLSHVPQAEQVHGVAAAGALQHAGERVAQTDASAQQVTEHPHPGRGHDLARDGGHVVVHEGDPVTAHHPERLRRRREPVSTGRISTPATAEAHSSGTTSTVR